MAGTLQIGMGTAKGIGGSGVASGSSVSLLTGMEIARSGFSYKTDADLVWTTFDLVSSQEDGVFRQQIHMLDRLKDVAGRYASDKTVSDPVYMLWAADAEIVRRAVVYDMSFEIMTEEGLNALLGKDAAKVRLAVQHSPFWEDTTVSNYAGTVHSYGGTIGLTLSDTSMPSRIQKFEWYGEPGNEFQTGREKLWAGIRDKRNGIAGFRPKWEAEYGTNATDASDIADANASNGTAVAITFATETDMAKRFSVKWSNIATANYDDLAGRYLILGRMRLSAGTVETAIELRHGWLGQAGLESSLGVTFLSAVTDANLVNYNLIPLGVAEIPPTGDRDAIASTDGGASSPLRSYGLALYAERLSAGGSIVVDGFLLIPADHDMVIGSASVSYLGYCRAYTGDDDASYAVNYTVLNGWGNVEYSFENWNMPVDGGLLVVAAQEGTIHNLNGTVAINMDIIKRYRSYRGTE